MITYFKEFWSDARVLFIFSIGVFYGVTLLLIPYSNLMWILVLGGILLFFIIEYIVHRYLLHGYFSKLMPKAHEGHDVHHNDPNNLKHMLTPNIYNVPAHLSLWLLFLIVFQSIHVSSAIMLGLTIYHLYYEWAHFISHRPINPRTPWGRWMKKYHLLHHYKNSRHWYGVTNPVIDTIMGTNATPTCIETEKKNYIYKG